MKTMNVMVSGLIAISFSLTIGMAGAQTKSSKDLTVGEFTGIECSMPIEYTLTVGDANAVKVEGPAETLEKINAVVKNDVLSFDIESKELNDLVIHITAKDIKKIEVSGAAVLEGKNVIKVPSLDVTATGAPVVKLELDVANLSSEISGASSVTLTGKAGAHKSNVSGASSLKAGDLLTQTTEIDVSGASDARIDATETLKAEVSGAANLHNKSNPTTKEMNVTGVGTIEVDTTTFKFGDKNVMIYDRDCRHGYHRDADNDKKPFRTKYGVNPQWMGLELGLNGYMNRDFGFDMPTGYSYLEPDYGKSFSVGLNVFDFGVPIVKGYMTLVTGLGFEFNTYSYRSDYFLVPDLTPISAMTSGISYKKNQLSTSWFRIPLLLQFDSKQNKRGGSFHFSMGAIGAIKMGSHTYQKWESGDVVYKSTTKDDFNLNPFKADATVRIGYGYLNFFVNYSLTSMFRNNEGPHVYPVSAGITLINL
jgi:hypothetical protein